MSIEMISNNKDIVLTGEIGTLLHNIGKLNPDFIKTKSKGNIRGLLYHARGIDKFIKTQLISF